MDFLEIIRKRKLHLAAVAGIAVVFSFVFTMEWCIPPKYKSTAVVYPVNIIPYSQETPTEQLLQLFRSVDVRAMMIGRFKLPEYYDIDTNKSSGKTKLFLQIDENIQVRKTEFESLKIDVTDTDPDTACQMVNALIHFVDVKARQLQREKTQEVVDIFRAQLDHKEQQIDSLEKVLNLLRIRYGLLDYKTQSKEATKSYLKMVGEGASREKLRVVDSLMRNLEQKGGELVTASEQMDGLLKEYNYIRSEYDKALSDLNKKLTYTNIVSKPFPADTKSYPVRWLIMLITVTASLMLSMIIFVLLDRRQNVTEFGSGENK